MYRIALALLILVVAGSALGAPEATAPASAASTPDKAMNIRQFLAHQEHLREDLGTAPRFEHMDNESKQRIYDSQDVLFALLRDRNSIEELSDDERLKVFDAQNTIAAVLTDAEDDRPLCKNTPRLGSHMHNIDCWSARESRLQKEVTQHELMRTRICVKEPGCNTPGGFGGH